MNKEIEELLKSVQPEVVKNETTRERIRKEKEEQEIKNLYDKAVNTSIKMNIEIAKKIIDVYLKRKEDLISWSYLGKEPLYEYDGIINFDSITTLNNCNSYKDTKNMTKSDQEAIELLRHINTPTELTKDFQEKALLWSGEPPIKLAFLNTKAFSEQGIKFQYPSYVKQHNFLYLNTDYDTIEKFTYNALENKLENGLGLSEEDIKKYKNELDKLCEKEKAISAFRAISEKNANIIALDILKQLVNNYKESPNLQPYDYLQTLKKCYIAFNNIIQNDTNLSEHDRIIIQEYLDCYPYSTDTDKPTLIVLPYQNDGNEKYLYMQDIDLKKILDSISIEYVINDTTLKAGTRVIYLEYNVNYACDEEKGTGNTK